MAVRVPSASAVACSSGAAAQNGITVVPSHGGVFYIDTGVTPSLDAGYIGYRVTNGTGSTQTDLWTEVSAFAGGKLNLNNQLDSKLQLPSLANGSTGTSYFMLKNTGGATTVAQTHTLKVYDNRPDLAGATLLYSCDFSFTKVQETIKAAANKVADNGLTSAAAIEVSDTTPELGQLVTITVEGQTGQIGAGSSPDFDIIWLTPAAVSSWPTRSLRLESVSVIFDGNSNWANTGDQVTITDRLLITGANGLTNVDNSEYRISYGFRVIGRPASSVKAVPVAQIASGTQVKHSDTGATGATLDISFSGLTINAALTKSVTATTGLTVEDCSGACIVPGGAGNGTYVSVPYRLTATSTTATTLTIDEYVDQAPTGVIFKPGSATVTDIGRTAVAIPDPVTITTDAAPKPLHFVGPFTLNSGTNASIDYQMWVPVGSFANTAYAKIGDFLIGATQSAMSRITVTSTGMSTVGVVSDTDDFSVSAVTDPATDVTTTTATINGTVDPNGTAVLTGQFEYGTSSTLVGASTITATTPASGDLGTLTEPTPVSVGLTGLSSGTIYYYRVKAGAAQGLILSFTTQAVQAAPTVTTTTANSVSGTGATLNGTINPNLTNVTAVQFIYGTSATLASGNTTVTEDDGTGLAALTLGGSSEQPFDEAITGLTSSTTYYFKIRACTSALTGSYPNVTCASFVDGTILNFSTGLTARTLTIDAGSYDASYTLLDTPPTITSTPSAGTGTKSYTSVTTGVCTINSSSGLVAFVSAGTCTIDADIASDETYDVADAPDVSFAVTTASRTLTIDAGSYDASYTLLDTPPTITSTPSAGTGTKSYTSVTTGVCTINSSSGLVAFVSAGTCTIDADIASDETYDVADAPDVSFAVTLASRTLTINAGSYIASYSVVATPPTITSTASAGAGAKTYTSTTTGVCTINSTSGLVTFVTAGTCTIDADIASDGTYDIADAPNVSFSLVATGGGGGGGGCSNCGSGSGSPTPTPPTPTPEPTPVPTPVPEPVPVIDFSGAAYDIYIVNPDGTERHMTDPLFARISPLSSTTDVIRFEDKGSDFDFNDVVLKVDHLDWARMVVTAVSVDAGWQHNVRMTIFRYGVPVYDLLIWPDSHLGVSQYALVNANTGGVFVVGATIVPIVVDAPYLSPTGNLPTLPPMSPVEPPTVPAPEALLQCSVRCADISYDLFIVNPDGTERHTGSAYVKVEDLGSGMKLYGFEDSGADFDHNDVLVVVDTNDCSDVRIEMLGVSASWHHRLSLDVSLLGQKRFSEVILSDTHAAIGYVKSVNAQGNPAMCTELQAPVKEAPSACSVDVPFTTPLVLTSSGTSVLRLQQLLRCLGFFPADVAPNSYYGVTTRAAVLAFQRANGIDPVGIVGPATRAALNAYVR